MPVVPSGELLDAVAEILARATNETDLSVRAEMLAHTRQTVDALLRGALSADEAVAALTETPPRSSIQRR
jgi:hypothetical protein